MKKRIKNKKEKLCKFIKRVKEEHLIKKYIKENTLFITFLLTCLINSTMIRMFTMHTLENYLSIKAIIADIAVLTTTVELSFNLICYTKSKKYDKFNN